MVEYINLLSIKSADFTARDVFRIEEMLRNAIEIDRTVIES